MQQERMQKQQDDTSQALSRKLKPHSLLPLFDGGDFDAEYNSKYKPVEFATPAGSQMALLEAVVTGVCLLYIPLYCWPSVHPSV